MAGKGGLGSDSLCWDNCLASSNYSPARTAISTGFSVQRNVGIAAGMFLPNERRSLDSFRVALYWPSAHFQSSSTDINNAIEVTCGKKKLRPKGGEKKKKKEKRKKEKARKEGRKDKEGRKERKEGRKERKRRMLTGKNRQLVKCTFRPTKTFQHSCVKGVRAFFVLVIFLCQTCRKHTPMLHEVNSCTPYVLRSFAVSYKWTKQYSGSPKHPES